MGKIYTAAIIGCGNRGWCFGKLMKQSPDKFNLIAVCDLDKTVRENAKNQWDILDENIYDDEREFFKEKRADVLVITTQDRDHVRMCVKAMELGYDILMEKPISPFADEIKKLLKAHKKYARKVIICHTLRYAPMFLKIKEILDSGVVGELIHIENTEQVEYWHQAHSFVRGNWRSEKETSPMIMQKCCHDFDMLQHLINARCKTVYSVGRTAYFKKQKQPKDASDRCIDCKYKLQCPYSAERIYIERWKEEGSLPWKWPYSVVCLEMPNTEEKIRKAYEENQYGRCVFACDNDVVDNQQVLMTFENGVTASHTMSAFTAKMGRKMILHGTLGEIQFFDDASTLKVCKFGGTEEIITLEMLLGHQDEMGHGGGDARLVESLYNVMEGNSEASTTLERSVESHLIAFAAEKSRHTGRVVKVHKK